MKNKIILILATITIVSLFSLFTLYKQFQSLQNDYSVSMENIKAYNSELNILKDDNRAYKLSVEQLSYFNDSITLKMNELRHSLRIKDNELKQMQYQLSHIDKTDSIFIRDTIFLEPKFKFDTLIGDQWLSNRILLEYPNKVKINTKVKSEHTLFVTSEKETINPPKKFFLFRWFQKKHQVLNIIVEENNPHIEQDKYKHIEIID